MKRNARRDISTTLFEFSQKIVGQFDLESLLEIVVSTCCELLNAEKCSIWLTSPDGQSVCLRGHVGYELDRSNCSLQYPLKPQGSGKLGITAWIALQGETFNARNTYELIAHPEHRGLHDQALHGVNTGKVSAQDHPCRSFYGGPIRIGDRVLGVLKVENKLGGLGDVRPPFFSNSDERLLQILAAMIATAIENAHLVENAHLREEETKRLKRSAYTIAHSIRNCVVPTEYSQEIMGSVIEIHEHAEKLDARTIANLRNAMDRMDEQHKSLEDYIEEFIEYSRPVEIRRQRVNVCELISDQCRFACPPPAVQIRQIPMNGCVEACVDAGRVSGIIKELLRNALKSILRSKKDGLITVSAELSTMEANEPAARGEPVLILSVEDNGGGIHPSVQDVLFEPFATIETKGTGLGLAIVAEVVRAHGGHYEAANLPTGGCRVRLYIPSREEGE